MYKITATFIVQQLATFSNYSQQPFLIINNKQLIIKCSRSLCNVLDHSVFSFTFLPSSPVRSTSFKLGTRDKESAFALALPRLCSMLN